MIGEVAGNYRITGKISEGGMGAVYRAEHTMIGKPAAVKVLLPAFSDNRDIVTRFFNEARATTQIRHPGIVEVFDFGYLGSGQAYLVMELLEGEPLSARIKRRGALSESEALAILRSVANALAAAHAKGIVHRDLKPDNVFLVVDPEFGERPKILDFGIAKLADNKNSAKTRTGSIMGTPTYMSPEQCRGTSEVDHRTDLYSLGCILYEMLTGRPPFVSEGAGEIIGAHLYLEPDSPRAYAPSISPATEQLVLHLLAKRPEVRMQSAAELAQRLGQMSTAHLGYSGQMPVASPAAAVTMPTPAPRSSDMPTTLSGAAAASVSAVPTRRARWPWFAAAGIAVATGGAIAIVAGGGHSQSPASVASPAQPTSTAKAPEPAPPKATAAPAPAPTPKPAPTPPPPAPPTLEVSGSAAPVPAAAPTPTAHPAQTAGTTTASGKTHRRPHDPSKAGSGATTAKPAQGSGSATVPIETDL